MEVTCRGAGEQEEWMDEEVKSRREKEKRREKDRVRRQ